MTDSGTKTAGASIVGALLGSARVTSVHPKRPRGKRYHLTTKVSDKCFIVVCKPESYCKIEGEN